MAQWMRVLDTVSGLAQLTERFRRPASPDIGPRAAVRRRARGLEARMAGVLVAALKEAFDRDSTRLEMERSQIEAERQRAEEALRAELRRQAGERALGSAAADRGHGHRGVGAVGGAERVAARHARRRPARAARVGLGARARRPGHGTCWLAARSRRGPPRRARPTGVAAVSVQAARSPPRRGC